MSLWIELLGKEKREYVFREQTMVWKDDITDEYHLYTTVILESGGGWNRFDYPAFNHGSLPEKDMNVIVHRLKMRAKKIYVETDKYILDEDMWDPEYRQYKTIVSRAF